MWSEKFYGQGVYLMPVKLFIFGRPGSGKSHAARFFELEAKMRGGSYFRINDYEFLRQQFLFDFDRVRFQQEEGGGFSVIDGTVLNEALSDVKKKAWQCYKSEQYDLIIIEFARSNYRKALQIFEKSFLQDAFFLYIHTELSTCFKRIRLRATNPQTLDDIFLPRTILNSIYDEDSRRYMLFGLAADLGLQDDQVLCIKNMGSVAYFEAYLAGFFQVFENRIGRSCETDPLQHIPAIFECVASK